MIAGCYAKIEISVYAELRDKVEKPVRGARVDKRSHCRKKIQCQCIFSLCYDAFFFVDGSEKCLLPAIDALSPRQEQR